MDPRPDWRLWAGLAVGLVAGIALIAFTGLHNAEPLLRWLGVAGTHGRSAVFAVIFGMSALLLLIAGAVVLGLHDDAAGEAGVYRAVRNVLLVIVGALCGWALALLYTPFGSEDAARLHSISQALTVFASGYLLSKLDRLLERALFGADGTPGRGWIYALLFAGALLASLLMTFSARQYGSGEDDAPGGASFTAAPGTVVLEGGRRIEVGADGRLRVAGIDYGPIAAATRVALAGAGGAILVDGVVRAPVPAKPAPTPPPAAPKPTPQGPK